MRKTSIGGSVISSGQACMKKRKKKEGIILLPRLRHLKLSITQHFVMLKKRRTGICQ